MQRILSISAAVLIAAMAWLPSVSQAAESNAGWYAGASIGQAKLSVSNQRIVGDEGLSDTTLSVHTGYRFGRYFAVEGSFADLGDFHYTANTCRDACIPELASTRFEHSATRLDLAVIGAVPLGRRLQAYGRVGLASTELETVTRTVLGTNQSQTNDLSAVYGVGVRASFDSAWSVRLQWDRSSFSKGNDLDFSTLWLGAEYQFGGHGL